MIDHLSSLVNINTLQILEKIDEKPISLNKISGIKRKKSKTSETKNNSDGKTDILAPNKQVKSNKSEILVLDQMIE